MIRFLLIPALWLGCVLVLYSVPGSDLSYKDPWYFLRMDKVAHVVMFLILSHSIAVALRKQRKSFQLHRLAMPLAIICALICGATLEFVQSSLFQERTTDIADFVANATGALLGPVLFRLIYGSELYGSADRPNRRQGA